MFCAVVPVRSLANGKLRLADALDQDTRASLVQAMLLDLLDSIEQTPSITRTLVVSSDPTVQQLAQRRCALVLDDPVQDGLNAALAHALRWLREAGWNSALVLPGDIPFASPEDLQTLVSAVSSTSSRNRGSDPNTGLRRLALAPDLDGTGTNALALTPPDLLPLHFGIGSCQAHGRAALALPVPLQLLQLPTLALDIDTPEDLILAREHLARHAGAKHTRRVLLGPEQPVAAGAPAPYDGHHEYQSRHDHIQP